MIVEASSDVEIDQSDDEYGNISAEIAFVANHGEAWYVDTGASSHMTGRRDLFSEIRPVSNRFVHCGGGKLAINGIGTATIHASDGTSREFRNVLFVPELGVNLISGKRLIKNGMSGFWDDKTIGVKNEAGKMLLIGKETNGIFILSHLGDEARAFNAMEVDEPLDHDVDGPARLSEANATPNEAANSTPDRKLRGAAAYQLWHRRFGHLGTSKLRHLHLITRGLKNGIPTKFESGEICDACAATKIQIRRNREPGEARSKPLDLISLDICGPVPEVDCRQQIFHRNCRQIYSENVGCADHCKVRCPRCPDDMAERS